MVDLDTGQVRDESYISAKDKYINQERDITKDSDEKRQAILGGSIVAPSGSMGAPRASSLSLNSAAHASQSGRRSA